MNTYDNHIAIIGGGIAGLALGIMLNRNNIPNIIFEKSANVSEYGAGISISPNGKFVLEKLGILDEIKINSGNSLKTSFYSNLKKIITIDTNIITTSRKCLHDVLYKKFINLGGKIKFDYELDDIDTENKYIRFKNGELYKVLHIAACDGIKSLCHKKQSILNNNPKYSGYSVWRTIFESNQTSINFHLGSNFHVVCYPIDKKRVSFIAAFKNSQKLKESWREKGCVKDLMKKIPSKILDQYKLNNENVNIFKWGVYIRPQIEFLYKKNVTFLGDAAHPIVPFIGQGGCMALEDAYAFGFLINKHKNNLNIAQKKYQEIRLNRIKFVHKRSLYQAKLNHISNPLLVYIRNLLMKHSNIIFNRTKHIWSYDITSKLS